MPTTANTITARALLALAEPFGPAVEDGELVFGTDPPADLESALRVLHTGVRALLTGRQWWGSSASDAKRPRVDVLNPGLPIPAWCRLLCVAGDTTWDRLHPAARSDRPHLFAAAGAARGA